MLPGRSSLAPAEHLLLAARHSKSLLLRCPKHPSERPAGACVLQESPLDTPRTRRWARTTCLRAPLPRQGNRTPILSGGETAELVGVKVRGMKRLFRHQKEREKSLSCARWLCLLYLRRCAARWLRPVGTPSHRVQNSGGSVGLGLAPRKVRAVCERGKGGGGLEASGSFRPVSQRDKRMIGRSVSTFPDRSNERRKAVRTVQESRYRSLAFSH